MSQVRLKISKKSFDALQKLAELRKHTLEETLNHAINTEVYMDEKLRDGCVILAQDKDNQVWKVIFTHMKEGDQLYY